MDESEVRAQALFDERQRRLQTAKDEAYQRGYSAGLEKAANLVEHKLSYAYAAQETRDELAIAADEIRSEFVSAPQEHGGAARVAPALDVEELVERVWSALHESGFLDLQNSAEIKFVIADAIRSTQPDEGQTDE